MNVPCSECGDLNVWMCTYSKCPLKDKQATAREEWRKSRDGYNPPKDNNDKAREPSDLSDHMRRAGGLPL